MIKWTEVLLDIIGDSSSKNPLYVEGLLSLAQLIDPVLAPLPLPPDMLLFSINALFPPNQLPFPVLPTSDILNIPTLLPTPEVS